MTDEIKEENFLIGIKQRAAALLLEAGIDQKEWSKRTGLSKGQYYRYHSLNTKGSALAVDLYKACDVFDWSPNYVLFGLGPKWLSEVKREAPGSEVRANALSDLAIATAKKNFEMLTEIHTMLKKERET